MKKRVLTMAMALCMLLSLLPVSASAADVVESGTCGADGDNVTYTLDSDGLLTISGTGEMEDYEMFDAFNNSPFYNNPSIVAVVIQPGVTSIGSRAFERCEKLEKITIPSGVTTVGTSAFSACTSLTNVRIPEGVTYIESGAFEGCISLNNVILPSSLESIGEAAFIDCSEELCVNIADLAAWCNIDFLECNDSVFWDHNIYFNGQELTNLIIPTGVTCIKKHVFYGCRSIKNVVIPDGVKRIELSAFGGCRNLESVTIPRSVTFISGTAFSDFGYGSVLKDIYYEGSENDWNSITTDSQESLRKSMQNATIHFNASQGESIAERFIFGLEHTYSFPNLTDKIDDAIIQDVFRGHAIGSLIRKKLNGDGTRGQCYGMAITAASSFMHNTPSESSYQYEGQKAECLSEIDSNWRSSETGVSASTFIKYGHLFQYMPSRQVRRLINSEDYKGFKGLCIAVKQYIAGSGGPVLLSMTPLKHEVLILGIEDDTDDIISFAVYDSNTPQRYGHVIFYREGFNHYSSYDYRYFNETTGCWITEKENYTFRYDEYAVEEFVKFWNGELSEDVLLEGYTNMLATDARDLMISSAEQSVPLNDAPTDLILPIEDTKEASGSENTTSLYWIKGDQLSATLPEGEAPVSMTFASCNTSVSVNAPGGTTVGISAEETGSAFAELSLPETGAFSVTYLLADSEGSETKTVTMEGTGTDAETQLTDEGVFLKADNTKDVIITYAVNDTEIDTVSIETLTDDILIQEDQDHITIQKVTDIVESNPFTDVTDNAFYYEPVIWAVYHDPAITMGTDATHFSPDATCTRAQAVTFLWRAMDCPEPETTDNPFSDVAESDWYYKPVLWAAENNITSGVGGGRFDPDGVCNRSQIVTFLWRATKPHEAQSVGDPFSDVPATEWFAEPVAWAVDKGITFGIGNGQFGPFLDCTRGQIVTFLYRCMK